ncbi:Uncharacterized protein TPAR_06268 [Tolypocladium paradoxum]|uniref:Uncharacterized protein n=1 Tax=Tolypocladium paradoxum TaxID=94208 RepID=A0A2S4KTR1_9HYPO|nr:Uncharacterized protein TPAR_06268 [Tolypocladium paradoxum]
MASFARSFKPPAAYLSPCRRPGMPGRTLSNSSELSLTSSPPADDAVDRPVYSAPGTPTITGAPEEGASAKNSPDAFPVSPPRSGHSRPIAIELPKRNKKLNTTSVYTPPEPLSARGDLPGGYFPMHEDPKGRVHRPHPFHPDAGLSRYLHSDSAAMQADRKPTSHPAVKSSMTQANMPVSSYIAPGFHDNPLPMGKYYPSNYEQQQQQQRSASGQRNLRPSVSDTLSSSVESDSQVPQYAPGSPRAEAPEVETRRRMQQYQRDMIAQAAMALGGSAKVASKSGAGVSLNGVPLRDPSFAGASPYRPTSPRLDPLGSPGPVTPMELEASGGGYLDKGKKAQDGLPKENLAPPGAGFTAHAR